MKRACRIFEDMMLKKGCPFVTTKYITCLVLHLTLTFSGASGSAQEMCLRVCFLFRRDKTFSSLMDVLLKSLPLLLPQKDHLVLTANIATLGMMMARILASSAGQEGFWGQSCTCLCTGRDQALGGWAGESKYKGNTSSSCHWKSDKTKNLQEQETCRKFGRPMCWG